MIFGRQGGTGGMTNPILDDIICEQPVNVKESFMFIDALLHRKVIFKT